MACETEIEKCGISPERQTLAFLCGGKGLEDRLINFSGRINPHDTMYGKST